MVRRLGCVRWHVRSPHTRTISICRRERIDVACPGAEPAHNIGDFRLPINITFVTTMEKHVVVTGLTSGITTVPFDSGASRKKTVLWSAGKGVKTTLFSNGRNQEGVVGVLGGHRCCGHLQVVWDDKLIRVIALASKDVHPFCRNERLKRVSFCTAQFVRKQQLDLLDDLARGIGQVLPQHFVRLRPPHSRAELPPVVKCTRQMASGHNEIVRGVEEDACWTLRIAAAKFLRVSVDVRAAEAETAPVDCNRIVLRLGPVWVKDDNRHRNGFVDVLVEKRREHNDLVGLWVWHLLTRLLESPTAAMNTRLSIC